MFVASHFIIEFEIEIAHATVIKFYQVLSRV